VGAKSKCLDIRRLRQIIPDLAFTPLEAGLTRTIDWFMKSGLVNHGRAKA
jgi:GDP-L-fucose synthase